VQIYSRAASECQQLFCPDCCRLSCCEIGQLLLNPLSLPEVLRKRVSCILTVLNSWEMSHGVCLNRNYMNLSGLVGDSAPPKMFS
jgi:hypothetical protein